MEVIHEGKLNNPDSEKIYHDIVEKLKDRNNSAQIPKTLKEFDEKFDKYLDLLAISNLKKDKLEHFVNKELKNSRYEGRKY